MLDGFINWYLGLNRFRKTQSDKLALHKPLVLIYALKLCLESKRWIDYERDYKELNLIISGYSKANKANCPLPRLIKDNKEGLEIWTSYPSISDEDIDKSGNLIHENALEKKFKFGFKNEIYNYFRQQPNLCIQVIYSIISEEFPSTLHSYILSLFNIDPYYLNLNSEIIVNLISTKINKQKRDPKFRINVMEAYDYKCCICGLSIQIGEEKIAMQAAHIKWFAQGGTCDVQNGLSLCPTHHYSFDRGIWSLSPDEKLEFIVSSRLVSNSDNHFMPFKGKSIYDSVKDKSLLPNQKNINWHYQNLFLP